MCTFTVQVQVSPSCVTTEIVKIQNQNREQILRKQETRRTKKYLQQTMRQSKFSNLFKFVCNRIET